MKASSRTCIVAALLAAAFPTIAQDTLALGPEHQAVLVAQTTIVSESLLPDGRLEIVVVEARSVSVFPVNCGPSGCPWNEPRKVKRIYAARDGRIVLLQTFVERRTVQHTETVTWEAVR